MVKAWLVLMLALPSLPIIAIFDYLVFSRFAVCPRCGDKLKIAWWHWLIPTFIEFVLFMAGVALGMSYVLGVDL